MLDNRIVTQGIQHRAPLRLQHNRQLRNRQPLKHQETNRATAMQNVKVKVLWPIRTIAGKIHLNHGSISKTVFE